MLVYQLINWLITWSIKCQETFLAKIMSKDNTGWSAFKSVHLHAPVQAHTDFTSACSPEGHSTAIFSDQNSNIGLIKVRSWAAERVDEQWCILNWQIFPMLHCDLSSYLSTIWHWISSVFSTWHTQILYFSKSTTMHNYSIIKTYIQFFFTAKCIWKKTKQSS